MNRTTRDRRRRRPFSISQKRGWVARFEKEGGTALEFARKYDLTHSAFLKWTKRFRAEGALLPVRVVPQSISPARSDDEAMEVHLNNGRKIRLSAGFNAASVRELIGILEETC